MELKVFATVFATVFLAELGDKTQLATLLFAARDGMPLFVVFAAASLALVASAGLAVLVGSALTSVVSPRALAYVAGAGFIAIGIWTLWQAGTPTHGV